MPVNNGQTVAQAWERYVGDKPEDNIFEEYALLEFLSKGDGFKGVKGGRDIRVTLEYATNTTVSSYADTGELDTTRVDFLDESEIDWKEIAGTAVISERERAINQGDGGKLDLEAAKLENLNSSLDKILNEQLFSDGTGNSSLDVSGLQYWISSDPTTGTVAGIDRASYAFYRNQQTTGTATSSDFDNLRSALRSIDNLCRTGFGDRKGKPAWFTTRTVFEGYESLLVANERYEGDKGTGDGFFKNENLRVKGAPIFWDADCPSATAYRLNTSFLKLVYQKGHWKKMFAPVDPANQTVDVYKVRSMCNLTATNPRRLGVVTAIS